MRIHIVLVIGAISILAGGCASSYSPRADLSSVRTIGVVVPEESGSPHEASDVIQLYNLTEGEGRLRNTAVGAGTGAGAGSAAGVGAGALIGCSAGGPIGPICWAAVITAGALLGGTTGAIAGAVVDTDLQQVETAQVHLYEINQVLPELKKRYLASSVLQEQALQVARRLDTKIDFVAATRDGERYASSEAATFMPPATDVNLVLDSMNVSLNGKARDDPELTLNVTMRWALTKHNPEIQNDETWDAMTASYESEKYRLSKWLADDGSLLMTEIDTGIEHSLTNAFSDLPRMAQR